MRLIGCGRSFRNRVCLCGVVDGIERRIDTITQHSLSIGGCGESACEKPYENY
jgi:hypothetical protein